MMHLFQHHFNLAFLALYCCLIITVCVIWILWQNRETRKRLRADVIELIKEVDPGCRVQPKRNSSKHVCFYLTMGPPPPAEDSPWELYFDGGRNRFELFDGHNREILGQKTIGQGIELDVRQIRKWVMDTLYSGRGPNEPACQAA